ncbi:MAG: prepilin peptidase [Acidobacteriota bacterium]|nr:prepilin peptidase [Acidobacteriota bacterium]
MDVLIVTLVFLFGLILGSFLNVCVYRIPRDLSVVTPRSFCPECGQQLSWMQNVPVLSYLLLKGRCRFCRHQIGLRYPAVELMTGALFALIVWRYGLTLAACKWAVFDCLLITLFWTDLEERILPDELTLGGGVAGFLFAVFAAVPGPSAMILPDASWRWQSILNAGLGLALLSLPVWAIGTAYGRLRKREALGLGDVKLLMLLGVFLGPQDGLVALTLGAVGGALTGIAILIWTKKNAQTYELPFGSFLCAGAVLVPFL